MSENSQSQFCFLLCSERSGTNLIASMMGEHSQIYAPPPLHLVELLWSRLYMFGDLEREENWVRLLQHVADATGSRLGFAVCAEQLARVVDVRSFGAVYRYLYDEGMRRAGCSQVFVKENEAYRHLGLLMAEFPDASFLCQVRDPRDFLLSYTKLRKSPRKGSFFGGLRLWQEQQEFLANALCTLPRSRIRFQRYEDLLVQPEKTLRASCALLGLEFESSMLQFHSSDSVVAYSKTSRSVENVARPLMTANMNKYTREFSRGETILVELRLRHLMEFCGYTIDYPKIGVSDVVRLLAAGTWRVFRDVFRTGHFRRIRINGRRFEKTVGDLRRGRPRQFVISRRFF